ncbi:Terpene synthase 10 [Nymphaea thermarum]|nr:Terpene synthase 10 [Nymphaea thermarum]
MTFAIHHLEESTKVLNIDSILAKQVAHALELPLSRRMLRSEARNYIDVYEMMPGHHSSLLKLAKLDFNNVQSLYQAEVKEMLRWWRGLSLSENLTFSRDRLMECYLWNIGVNFNPRFSVCRKSMTKLICIGSAIDDFYDIYGTIDELELFTEAVDKWDVGYIDKLPQYMRMCFLALYNTTNQFVYDFMRDKGQNILGYLTRAWADQCKSYLVEAKWFYNGHTPTVEEYLDNARVSAGVALYLVHTYFLLQHDMEEDAAMSLDHYSNLVKMSSLVVRLHNDLGTSKDEIERGDVPKCIECYMKEKGVSEEAARQHGRICLKIANKVAAGGGKEENYANWFQMNSESTLNDEMRKLDLENISHNSGSTRRTVNVPVSCEPGIVGGERRIPTKDKFSTSQGGVPQQGDFIFGFSTSGLNDALTGHSFQTTYGVLPNEMGKSTTENEKLKFNSTFLHGSSHAARTSRKPGTHSHYSSKGKNSRRSSVARSSSRHNISSSRYSSKDWLNVSEKSSRESMGHERVLGS